MTQWYPCPCCGYLVHDSSPGSYAICDICFWEDDVAQLRWPLLGGGPNAWCLVEAQLNFEACGAMSFEFVDQVNSPSINQRRDDDWRRIDLRTDNFEDVGIHEGQPSTPTALYWWRPTFWRKDVGQRRVTAWRWLWAEQLKPGMILELADNQTLWDTSVSPWRSLTAGARLKVIRVTKVASGRPDRTPVELVLLSLDSNSRLVLEVADSREPMKAYGDYQ